MMAGYPHPEVEFLDWLYDRGEGLLTAEMINSAVKKFKKGYIIRVNRYLFPNGEIAAECLWKRGTK